MDIRVGIGTDRHRFGQGDAVRIGGVTVPHTAGFVAHSDGDVLLHAVTDALLGAAGLGDIGEMFPDTDEANRGRDSSEILTLAYDKVQQAGWGVVNVDISIHAQRPKLSPHKTAIRESVAALLGVAPDAIGVKAKTGEGVGPVGREECIDVVCVVLLRRE